MAPLPLHAIEDYALHRRHADGRAGGPRRAPSTGCACRASTRRPASPRCWASRATAAGCSRPAGEGDGARGAATAAAPWCWRPSSPPRRGACGWWTACRRAAASRTWCAWWRACEGEVAHAHGARHPLRLRLHRALGARAWTARCRRWPARTRWCCARRSPMRGEDAHHGGGLHACARASACPSCSPGTPRTTPPPRARRRRARAGRDASAGGSAGRASATYEGPGARTVLSLADHPQGAHLRAHRRHRRGATTSLPEWLGGVRNWDYRYCWLRDATFTLARPDRSAATARRRAAWRDWLLRAVAGDPVAAADHVRRGRRAPAARVRAGLAARLRGLAPGADRQRRRRPAPARRVRRGDGRAAPGAPRRAGPRPGRLDGCSARCWTSWRAWRAAGRGAVGGARAAPALHPLEGDGVGGLRPRGAGGRALRRWRGPSQRWRAQRDADPRARCASAASTRRAAPSPRPTARSAWTRACC